MYHYRSIKTIQKLHLPTTDRRRNLFCFHVDSTQEALSARQLVERLLRDVEARASGVDGRDIDHDAVHGVGHCPAGTAVGRVPHDVKRAADERERGEVAECREPRCKTVLSVGACDTVERAVFVVERVVERGAQR